MAYDNNKEKQESVYSKRIKAGKRRTYFFDVRETKGSDYYLTITESRKRFDSEGYDRHKIFLYKEDFNKFVKGLSETVDYVKTELMPNFDFDAFNHEYPDGEEGYVPQAAEPTTFYAEKTVEKEVETVSVVDEMPAPADNGSTEHVDKW